MTCVSSKGGTGRAIGRPAGDGEKKKRNDTRAGNGRRMLFFAGTGATEGEERDIQTSGGADMRKRKSLKWTVCLVWVCTLLPLVSPGQADGPYIANETEADLVLIPSEAHSFEYIRLVWAGDRLVLYGKLDHRHHRGVHEGHVDVSVIDGKGEAVLSRTVSVVPRGHRRKGWRGAHFRTRLKVAPLQTSRIRMEIHEPSCLREETHHFQ